MNDWDKKKMVATASLGKTRYNVYEGDAPFTVRLSRVDSDGREYHLAFVPRALFDDYAGERASEVIGAAVKEMFKR